MVVDRQVNTLTEDAAELHRTIDRAVARSGHITSKISKKKEFYFDDALALEVVGGCSVAMSSFVRSFRFVSFVVVCFFSHLHFAVVLRAFRESFRLCVGILLTAFLQPLIVQISLCCISLLLRGRECGQLLFDTDWDIACFLTRTPQYGFPLVCNFDRF